MRRPPIQNFIFALIVFLSVLVSKATLNSSEKVEEPGASPAAVASVGPGSDFAREFGSALLIPVNPAAPPANLEEPAAPVAPAPIPAEPALPEITAIAALTGRLGDGLVLYKLDAYRRHPAASLTKLMTALVVLEKLDPEAAVTITPEHILEEGEAGNFTVRESYSVSDLLQVMLAVSSNDAAAALADAYGDAEIVEAMNRRARDLGMTDTSFADAAGLSFLNQTTAWDLYKLVRFISDRYPIIFTITRAPQITVLERASGRPRRFQNINNFAGRRGFLGGKTGYTDEARQNLVSIFEEGKNIYAVIVLGSEARFEETEKILAWLSAIANKANLAK